MRPINRVFRFIIGTIVFSIFAIVVYIMTIVYMFMVNWDREFESLKTIHKELFTEFCNYVWGNEVS